MINSSCASSLELCHLGRVRKHFCCKTEKLMCSSHQFLYSHWGLAGTLVPLGLCSDSRRSHRTLERLHIRCFGIWADPRVLETLPTDGRLNASSVLGYSSQHITGCMIVFDTLREPPGRIQNKLTEAPASGETSGRGICDRS